MSTQKLLYNKIIEDYKKYYYNEEAKFYRKKIFLNQIRKFGDKKKSVIEIGCGPGYSLKILKESGFKFKSYYGIDVSNKSVEYFKKIHTKSACRVLDFSKRSIKLNRKFDIIFFNGCIHHMSKKLPIVFSNCKKILKKNGIIIMIEPNGSFLNFFRNLWYKFDNYFNHKDEEAVTIKTLDIYLDKKYRKIYLNYFGFAGFFLVLQSMILRTPSFFLNKTYKILTYFDLLLSKFNMKYLSAAYVIVYKKN
mgnify:CR=1 FL=1